MVNFPKDFSKPTIIIAGQRNSCSFITIGTGLCNIVFPVLHRRWLSFLPSDYNRLLATSCSTT